MAAIEIAKARKAIVIACGGNDENCQNVLKVPIVLNYNKIIRQELRKLRSEVDVVIDMVGGQPSLDLVKSLNGMVD